VGGGERKVLIHKHYIPQAYIHPQQVTAAPVLQCRSKCGTSDRLSARSKLVPQSWLHEKNKELGMVFRNIVNIMGKMSLLGKKD
jgi:hypothetical protein